MDFFEHQEKARKRTALLVFYYGLAVALIISAVYLAFEFILFAGTARTAETVPVLRPWNLQHFLWVGGFTGVIILAGTTFKIIQLAQGGAAVARLLGGKPLSSSTSDIGERRLLNVVEEMALASGIPVPQVFVLQEEEGINALAAGFSTRDAIIAVTRGCLQHLTRDQLQGVIAHEFSHILNGDMRLNIRLIGVLNGILVIALIGYGMLRLLSNTRMSRNRKGGGGVVVLFLLGLALLIIGYVGVFFGKLIKSAVSRQREFLADASAVQFTRNPDGIAGALKKILGFASGSKLTSAHTEEASHLFFANGLSRSFLNLMATHPPLDERIRRIDPAFTGKRKQAPIPATPLHDPEEEAVSAAISASDVPHPVLSPPPLPTHSSDIPLTGSSVLKQVGNPDSKHLHYAERFLASLPQPLLTMVRDPLGAQAVVYVLLLEPGNETRQAQLQHLARAADARIYCHVQQIITLLPSIRPAARLPLVDLVLPALRSLSKSQYDEFHDGLMALAAVDSKISLFEYALLRTVARHLAPIYRKTAPVHVQQYSLVPLQTACATLLGTLARGGTDQEDSASHAFAAGWQKLADLPSAPLPPVETCTLITFDAALVTLNTVTPRLKKQLLDACATCIAVDGRTSLEEAELLRTVADAFECPIPPFLVDAA